MILKFSVKIKANKSENRIVKTGENSFEIYLKSRPIDNRANLELLQLLSDYFKVNKSQIVIKSGLKSKLKIIEIDA